MPRGTKRSIGKIRMGAPPQIYAGDPDDADIVDFSKMPKGQQLRMQKFCHEYIKDFNGGAAVQRMGYPYAKSTAHTKAWQYLENPYTQWYLAQLMQKCEEQAIVTKNEILFGLKREANYYGADGGSAARVGALRALAKILGLEITKVEANVEVGGGVMTLPFTGSLEQWENACKDAQSKLKEEVRK